jgi:hypothetical protein
MQVGQAAGASGGVLFPGLDLVVDEPLESVETFLALLAFDGADGLQKAGAAPAGFPSPR